MVKPGPDVPYALVEIIEEGARPANGISLQTLGFLIRAKDRRMRPAICLCLDTQQPAMLRIEIEEKIVADLQNVRRCNAIGGKLQHLVGAVTVVIDEMFDGPRGAGLAVRLQCQMGKQIGGNRRLEALQLAPGDDPIIVYVEAKSIVEVTQRHVPFPDYFTPFQPESKVRPPDLYRGWLEGDNWQNCPYVNAIHRKSMGRASATESEGF
jgi:hypothetical protein